MKQLLILSGKGGTGKTTIAGAFIKLSRAKAYADCDVDAPNLHLVIHHCAPEKTTDYYGLPKAQIDAQRCTQCDRCRQNCRFDAIRVDDGYRVNPFACEGCGVCEAVCPAAAITMHPAVAGALMLHDDGESVFSTARLKMGSGTSGMLVTEVKKQMRDAAPNTDIAIIDGSPGIGCPVIASLSGVDLVLIVAEPTVSGISDMERIIKTAKIFQTTTAVCVNKFDTNVENTDKINQYCQREALAFTGVIPFDAEAVKAVNNGQTIADVDCAAGRAAKAVFDNTIRLIPNNNGGGNKC
ncbi:MAG: ATP-binding protein [Acetanaerobacterium sp.]